MTCTSLVAIIFTERPLGFLGKRPELGSIYNPGSANLLTLDIRSCINLLKGEVTSG